MKQAVLLIAICGNALYAFSQTTFQKLFSVAPYTRFEDIISTSDGGFLVGGSGGSGSNDHLLIKLDINGNIQWARHYGSWTGNETAYSLGELAGGGYYFTGSTDSYNLLGDASFVKTDVNGNTTFNKTISVSGDLFSGKIIMELPNGDFIIASDHGLNTGGNYYTLTKTTPAGALLWSKSITTINPGLSNVKDLIVNSANTYTILSSDYSSYGGLNIGNIDPNGNVLWHNIYFDAGFGVIYPCNIENTSDGGYIVGAKFIDPNTSMYSFVLMKLNSGGSIAWMKRYDDPSVVPTKGSCLMVKQTSDKGYIATAGIVAQNGISYASMLRFDSLGAFQWARYYTTFMIEDNSQSPPEFTSDGGIAGVFTALNPSFTSTFGYLIKIDQNGSTGCNEINYNLTSAPMTLTVQPEVFVLDAGTINTVKFTDEPIPVSISDNCQTNVGTDELPTPGDISIYPNPSGGIVNCRLSVVNGDPVMLEVYNSVGEKIYSSSLRFQTSSIDLSSYPEGLYFLHFKTGQGSFVRSVVIGD